MVKWTKLRSLYPGLSVHESTLIKKFRDKKSDSNRVKLQPYFPQGGGSQNSLLKNSGLAGNGGAGNSSGGVATNKGPDEEKVGGEAGGPIYIIICYEL